MVLPYINMNPPQVYMSSPSWNPFQHPSPSHPSGSFQCTSPKHPASCIEPGLAIHFIYDITHVSIPFSQIIPPSSPTESKRLFSLFKTPFAGQSSIPTSLVSLFVFYIFPTSFWRQSAAFLGAWSPLPAFQSCFVEFPQCLAVLLMNLWGRKWSPHPIPPPS